MLIKKIVQNIADHLQQEVEKPYLSKIVSNSRNSLKKQT